MRKRCTSVACRQCEQMARIFFQYLAIYKSVNLPKSIKYFPKQVQSFANQKIKLLKVAQILKKLPKWRNFAKSGHTTTETALRLSYFFFDHKLSQQNGSEKAILTNLSLLRAKQDTLRRLGRVKKEVSRNGRRQ